MKRSRDFFVDMSFAVSYPLVIGIGLLWNEHIKAIGGAAIGGKLQDNVFFVKNSEGVFSQVSSWQWLTDFCLGLFTLFFGFIATLGLAYFPIKYFFLPHFQGKKHISI